MPYRAVFAHGTLKCTVCAENGIYCNFFFFKIDTLLRDMSLPEGAPLSPTAVAHSNGGSPVKQQQSADIYQWLKGHDLSGYASVLESSGFDCKDFLNGGILAMDDLADIGMTEEGDR